MFGAFNFAHCKLPTAVAKSTKRRRFLKNAAVTAGAISVAGCTGSIDGGGSGIHIGFLNPFSGVYAEVGEHQAQGVELAREDFESEFEDIDVEVTEADSETDADVAVRQAERLVERDNVDVLMGIISSSAAVNVSQWSSRNEVAFMNAGSHTDSVTGEGCGKYTWRVPSSNTMTARTVGASLADHADSYFIIYADYSWGVTGKEAIRRELEDRGVDVVSEVAAPLGAEDYSSQLAQLEESGADALANITGGGDNVRITRQFIERGLQDEFKMGGPLLEDINYWGMTHEEAQHVGVYGTSWSPAVRNDRIENFMSRVKDQYDITAYSRHYYGYTAMDQILRGYARAGSVNADDIKDEMAGHDYTDEGLLSGTQKWRACDGQNLKPTYTVKPQSVDEMTDEPYRIWFEQVSTKQADEVARTCEETGCEF